MVTPVSLKSRIEALLVHETREREATQVFDGAMLSDGTIPGSTFSIVQAGKEHLDWLLSIHESLNILGVSAIPPKLLSRTISLPRFPRREFFSDRYEYSYLRSHPHSFIRDQRARWYPSGVKEVPEDLLLTIVCLANWFMGDGSSARCNNSRETIQTCIYTQGYNIHSVELLEVGLHNLGIVTGRSHDKKCSTGGIIITILQESVNDFMNTIKPYIVPSFEYKLKWKRNGNT